jgi:hypothetical protein
MRKTASEYSSLPFSILCFCDQQKLKLYLILPPLSLFFGFDLNRIDSKPLHNQEYWLNSNLLYLLNILHYKLKWYGFIVTLTNVLERNDSKY